MEGCVGLHWEKEETCGQSSGVEDSRSQEQRCPMELSAVMEMRCTCAVQHYSHKRLLCI